VVYLHASIRLFDVLVKHRRTGGQSGRGEIPVEASDRSRRRAKFF
jgi:hypothetical protein